MTLVNIDDSDRIMNPLLFFEIYGLSLLFICLGGAHGIWIVMGMSFGACGI